MVHQNIFWLSREMSSILVVLCIILGLALSETCAEVDGVSNVFDYAACGSSGENCDLATEEMRLNYVQGEFPTSSGFHGLCTNSELFCFPSTLHDFLPAKDNYKVSSLDLFQGQCDVRLMKASVPYGLWGGNSSWSADYGTFKLANGNVVSCSFSSEMKSDDSSSSQNGDSDLEPSGKYHKPLDILDKESELIASDILHVSSSPSLDITPPYLDWGQSYLYFPSLAFLTVSNTCNDSSIQIYKPFTTNTQFYPCNFDGMVLDPGEVAKICFVFLPRKLGLLSGHIVLQTSSGGFLIHAEGLVVESLYQIQPLIGLTVSLDGGLNKNLSLYNPFDDTLYVKEVTAWISFSSGNISHTAEAVCKTDNFQSLGRHGSLLDTKEWLDVKNDQLDQTLMALRPHKSWEIQPHSTETIMEINLLSGAKGSVFGAFSMEVQSSSQEKADFIVVPLEAEVHGETTYSNLKGSVLVYLQSMPCEECESSIVISLKNMDASLLRIAEITEITEGTRIFHIKYMDGLLLFPGSVTQIAVITFQQGNSQESSDETVDIHLSCKLLVSTNDSVDPLIEVPCHDVVKAGSKQRPLSYIGRELRCEGSNTGSEISGSSGNTIHSSSRSTETKPGKIAETDEMVLKDWKAQATSTNESVLVHEEVQYPVVQVGTHCSKWISVKNPTEQPVLVQLILNSATVVDQCRSLDKLVGQPVSSSLVQNESTGLTRYGFFIADTAVSEAFVHPYGEVQLGPVIFHPSSQCGWRGSALIRNNLSGVEWLSLKGFGGSFSLVLLENSEPIKILEFNLTLPYPQNISPEERHHMENKTGACSMSVLKEVHVMNRGDLPLDVRKIEISGTKCGLDGFMVHPCSSFGLEPGESRMLRLSYRTDFSAALLHRDLELALTTGIFVIPMKANIPVHMLSVCRRSFFGGLLKNHSLMILISLCATCVVFSFILPRMIAIGTPDYLFKTKNASIRSAIKLCVKRDQSSSKFSLYDNIISFKRSVRENETLKLCFVGRFSVCSNSSGVEEKAMPMQDVHENGMGSPGPKSGKHMSGCSSELKAVTLESSCSASEAANLTVKVGKEKGRRRRKRRANGGGTGKMGLLEVSSSQSGNSTPSSPMSPVLSSFAPKTTWPVSPDIERAIHSGNPFVKVADQNLGRALKAANGPAFSEPKVSVNNDRSRQSHPSDQRSEPKKAISKSVLLPSASFPCATREPDVVSQPRLLRCTSAMDPNAKAPGSNLKDKSMRNEENKSWEDRYTYDIWGNHLSGIHLVDKVKDVSTIKLNADSQSFFVMGPQILMEMSRDPHPIVTSPQQIG